MDTPARIAALSLLAFIVVALCAAIIVSTPWQVLPAGGGIPSTSSAQIAVDFSAAERQLIGDYQSRFVPAASLGLIVGLLVSIVLGLTPLGARVIESVSAPFGGGWWSQVTLGTLAVLVIGRVLALPFDIWTAAVRRDAGLLTSTWSAWTVDQLRSFGVTAVIVLIAVIGWFGIARVQPRWGWAIAAGIGAMLVVVLSLLYPLLVEPLFNRFTSMPDGEVRQRIVAMAQAEGVPVSDVLVADASRRTTALNAYVSGFGPTRRVVVYDTLLQQEPAVVESVVAHELGHAAEDDVLKGTLIGALAVAAGAIALALLTSVPSLMSRIGSTGAADPKGIAFVMAAVALASAAFSPITMAVSRHVEARADAFALDVTRDATAFAIMQKRLTMGNLSALEPAPVRYLMLFTHPTGPQRIELAREWAHQESMPVPPPLADVPAPGPAAATSPPPTPQPTAPDAAP